MKTLKNILKSTVFIGGTLGALPAMATTTTINPVNYSNFLAAWNDANVETIRFNALNSPANPSSSRVGGLLLTSALPVPPRSKIVDASNLIDFAGRRFYPIDIQTADSDGRLIDTASATAGSPQVTFRSINLGVVQPPSVPSTPTSLNLNYPGQMNLVASRVIAPVKVSGSGNITLGYEVMGEFNTIARDTNLSASIPTFTVEGGQLLLGNTNSTSSALKGGTAFSGVDSFSAGGGYTPAAGNFVFSGGTLVFDLTALARDKVAKTATSGPNYLGNTGTLSGFNTINIGSNNIAFTDGSATELTLLSEADINTNKLIYVLGSVSASSGTITLPAAANREVTFERRSGNQKFTYKAMLVEDTSDPTYKRLRLEIELLSIETLATSATTEQIFRGINTSVVTIKNRPTLTPLTDAQRQALQAAIQAMNQRALEAQQNTTQQGTIPSYTRDTLPAGTIICEFNQIRRAVQGRFGVKGLTLSMTPDHSSQVSRMMAEAGLVRDGSLAPLRLLNKTWNLWVAPQGSHGQSKAAVGAPKSRQRSAGANGGLAYKINDQLSAVASFALNQAHSKSKDNTSKSRSDVYSGMAMVRYTPSFYYVDGGITLAPVHTEDRRKHPVAGNPRIRSKSRGYTHGFMAGVGATAPLFGIFLQPRFDYNWTRSMTRASKDKNGGEFANRTAKMSGAQHQTNLGMDVAKPFPLENGLLGVQVGAYWARYKSAKNPRIRVYSKLMKDVMGTSGWTVDKSRSHTMNNVRASVGAQFVHQKGVSVGGQYGYEHGRYMRQHSGMIRVGYAF